MEMATSDADQKGGRAARVLGWFKALPGKLGAKVVDVAMKMKKLGQDDPRRFTHSLKVALAITLVSLFYYFEPLYNGFGVSAMWAVLTVVVVFEFSVGATIGRGINRGIATLVAGAFGFFAHHLASLTGKKGEPVLLGVFVFVLAGSVTFLRFFPRVKARYDYGLLIFILTFCLVSVSGYRDDEVLQIAHQRLSTILIGALTALVVSILICPVWAGLDLHNLVAANIEKLGSFMEGFGGEYFKTRSDGDPDQEDKTCSDGYKNVLNSKTIEESLANFARWEPPHGKFRFHHPWKQYLKIGTLTRQCAYRIEALNGYIDTEIQAPYEIREKIQEACTKMSSESGEAMKELASAIRKMNRPSSSTRHIANSKAAAKNLKALLKTGLWKDTDLLEIIPAATVASLLIDVVSCAEKISDAVHELASIAGFKAVEATVSPELPKLVHPGKVQPCSDTDGPDHHVVKIIEKPAAAAALPAERGNFTAVA